MAEFGSFGNVSPEGMQAIKSALQRRQQGDPAAALSQQSGASSTPSPAPATPSGGVVPSPQGGGQAQNPESKIIVNALSNRLRALSDIEKPPTL